MKLHNTLTRQTDDIVPLEDHAIKLYTCGLTVYSQPHIGNWVAYIYWDVLVRVLRDAGYDVTRVQNITDVGHLTSDEDAGEDKMLKGALQEGLTAWQVADKYIAIANDEAYNQLGLIRPDHMPRATEYIPQQVAFVEELAEKGYVYTIDDGIYFDTSKLPNYGELARLDIEGLEFGARVADTGKKNPTDFAVWKFSPSDEKRVMEWNSPLGIERKGFPGWHLECSVMARELLGDQIDIHTGGIDHIPVHHINEIAQTEAVTGKRFTTYWVHANHMKVGGTKISKSLGNGYTLQDIQAKGFNLDAFKLMVLSKHYRTEGNFTWDILEASQNRLNGYRQTAALAWQPTKHGKVSNEAITDAKTVMQAALHDDLNSPEALAELSRLTTAIDDGGISAGSQVAFTDLLVWLETVLGISLGVADISTDQKALIADRDAARAAKDWATSDTIRDSLIAHGIGVRDTPSGAVWHRI